MSSIIICIEAIICFVVLKGYYKERLDIQYYETKKRTLAETSFFTYFTFIVILILNAFLMLICEEDKNCLYIIVPTSILLFGLAGMCYYYGKEIKKLKKEISLLKENNETLQKR